MSEDEQQQGALNTLRVFVVAGEPSGDRLGGYLLKAMHKMVADGKAPQFDRMQVYGVGGMRMMEQGLTSVFAMSFLSNNGVADVLRWAPQTLKYLEMATSKAVEYEPHIILTIDSKGFNLRMLAAIRREYAERHYTMPPCVQYVSPSFWAFKDGEDRLSDLRRAVDHVLCVLPFEPRGLRRHHISGSFVGHPSVEEELMRLAFQPSAPTPMPTEEAKEWLWSKFDNQVTKLESPIRTVRGPTIALLPGSRMGEVKRIMPRMYEAAMLLTERLAAEELSYAPQFFVLAAPEVESELKRMLVELKAEHDVKALQNKSKIPRNLANVHLVTEEKFPVLHTKALSGCDIAVAASGTITIHLALFDIPTVVVYCSDVVTEFLAPAVAKIPYAALPNVILLAKQHLDQQEAQEAAEKAKAKAAEAARKAAKAKEEAEEAGAEAKEPEEENVEEEEEDLEEEDDGEYNEDDVTFIYESGNAGSSVIDINDIHASDKPYPVYPELLGTNECTGANIAKQSLRLLNLSTAERQKMQQQLSQVVSMLNIPHKLPSEHAAEIVLRYVNSSTYMENE